MFHHTLWERFVGGHKLIKSRRGFVNVEICKLGSGCPQLIGRDSWAKWGKRERDIERICLHALESKSLLLVSSGAIWRVAGILPEDTRGRAPWLLGITITGFPCYLKVERSYATFLNWNGVKQRNDYLRTHLANRCTEQIEIEHRCSQDIVQSRGGLMLSLVPGKGAQRCCILAAQGADASILVQLSAKQIVNAIYFHFLPFHESENPLWILAKTGTNGGLSYKWNGINQTFEKPGLVSHVQQQQKRQVVFDKGISGGAANSWRKLTFWVLGRLQSSLGTYQGLVPGRTMDTKICGCSGSTVGFPYLRVPHPLIQPTADRVLGVPSVAGWMCW